MNVAGKMKDNIDDLGMSRKEIIKICHKGRCKSKEYWYRATESSQQWSNNHWR